MRCRTSLRGRTEAARAGRLPVQHALILGALHGPAELLPISSSGHTAVVPWLLGWPYPQLDAELRKSFEVALHAGAAGAVLLSGAIRPTSPRHRGRLGSVWRPDVLGPAVLAPAAVGLAFESQIERRLDSPVVIACALMSGAAALLGADRAAGERSARSAEPADGAWLGLAQALALVPGVSRTGATLVAARLRGFTRPAAWELSVEVGIPVLLGAAALSTVRLLQRRGDRAVLSVMLAGAGSSFASTLLCARWTGRLRTRPLYPYSAYRSGLGLIILARLRSEAPRSRARRFRHARL